MEFKESVPSGLNVEKRMFTWTINNFDKIRKSKELIDKQEFTFEAGETIGLESEWRWSLRWRDNIEGEKGLKKPYIGCFLFFAKMPEDIDVNEVKALFQVKTGRQRRKATFASHMENGQMTNGCGFRMFEQDADLKDLALVNGCLVLELEMKLFAPESLLNLNTHPDVAAVKKKYDFKFSQKLQQDLGNLLINPLQSCDAKTKIVTRDGKEFAVSRGILCARSPVFDKMFQTPMKESETGVIRITDLSSKTMSVFLRFIYTGTLHNDWRAIDVIAELVYAAGKYQLQDLLAFLNQVVGNVCIKANAGSLMSLARYLSMKKAEKDLFEYMKENASSFVSFTAPFLSVNVSFLGDAGDDSSPQFSDPESD